MSTTTHLVTGAFGYTGSRIAQILLESGHTVRTATSKPGTLHPLVDRIERHPLDFGDLKSLERALDGVDVLYNTYWVRFSKKGFSQQLAVQNTLALFDVARRLGVRRIVHVSITNPDEESPYEYFRAKAVMERELLASGQACSILRPAVIFGGEDILINNICWLLRRFPVFGIFGDGRYGIQPIHVQDFGELAVREGRATGQRTVDAVGPERFEYRELVACLARAMGLRRLLLPIPRGSGLLASRLLGIFQRDIVLTREEIGALMDGLLTTNTEPTEGTRLSVWARDRAATLGRRYASELARRNVGRGSSQVDLRRRAPGSG